MFCFQYFLLLLKSLLLIASTFTRVQIQSNLDTPEFIPVTIVRIFV